MRKVFTVLKKSEDETRVLVAYANREHAIRCAHALAGHHAAVLRRFDEEMFDAPVAPDLYYVVSKEDAAGVHLSTMHAIANEPGSGTRWLVQEIEVVDTDASAPLDDDDGHQPRSERSER